MRVIRGPVAAGVIVCAVLSSTPASTRSLSLEERVAAQRAIEQVYWNHRIWPKENPGPKPALDAVLPDAQLRARVTDYLKKSNALAEVWQRPIGAQQLQAELDRMAAGSRAPNVLKKLYTALGNDPFVIAETLARQTLADRLTRNWYARDERAHGALRLRAEAALAHASCAADLSKLAATYSETIWKLRGQDDVAKESKANEIILDADEWRETLTRVEALPLMKVSGLQETDEAFFVTAVLAKGTDTVTEATAAWPKTPFDVWWAARGASTRDELAPPAGNEYSLVEVAMAGPCSPDTWTPTSFAAPDARYNHTAIWTGSEMIVWGGYPTTITGARYNPATDSWVATTITGAPIARYYHRAVWTGSEMNRRLQHGRALQPLDRKLAADEGRPPERSLPAHIVVDGRRHDRLGRLPVDEYRRALQPVGGYLVGHDDHRRPRAATETRGDMDGERDDRMGGKRQHRRSLRSKHGYLGVHDHRRCSRCTMFPLRGVVRKRDDRLGWIRLFHDRLSHRRALQAVHR